jgi:hypothetical protein
MGDHATYGAIVQAVHRSDLSEPFTALDFEAACPGLGAGTYVAFLAKHAVGNPGGATELFDRVAKMKTVREEGSAIRIVQELRGHTDVSTTMIYTHVLNRGGCGVSSPTDRL